MERMTVKSRERFWSNVALAGASECWLWRGPLRAPQNYGTYNNKFSHRLAYADVKGPIPEGFVVRHDCDVPHCVNPNHLSLGTQGDNMRDKAVRGRAARHQGEKHPRHKLTAEQVLAIREVVAAGANQHELARSLGVSQPLINRIVKRVVWRHVQ